MMNRRSFLLGVGACAPALIAASNLMKVKALTQPSRSVFVVPPGEYDEIVIDSLTAYQDKVLRHVMHYSIGTRKFKEVLTYAPEDT